MAKSKRACGSIETRLAAKKVIEEVGAIATIKKAEIQINELSADMVP